MGADGLTRGSEAGRRPPGDRGPCHGDNPWRPGRCSGPRPPASDARLETQARAPRAEPGLTCRHGNCGGTAQVDSFEREIR